MPDAREGFSSNSDHRAARHGPRGPFAAVLAAGSENVAAHRLGLSHSPVEHHLANARSKVEASVLAQASSIRKTGVRGTSARASSNVPVAFSKPM